MSRVASERGELVLSRRARLPGGDGQLDRERDIWELRVNGAFVMDTAETTSERALASAALQLVEDPDTVLVGGLGLGFTAAEVLRDPRVRRVVVVEIEAELVHWMRGGTVPHGPRLLADERLSVTVGDIRDAISRTPPAAYDLVLLDVDNGPGQLVHEANAAIYRRDFLARVHEVTRPAGALAVWSAERSPALETELRAVFGNVVVLAHDVLLQTRQERFWLFCCQRRAS